MFYLCILDIVRKLFSTKYLGVKYPFNMFYILAKRYQYNPLSNFLYFLSLSHSGTNTLPGPTTDAHPWGEMELILQSPIGPR